MVVGYVAQLKVLAPDGSFYWAMRTRDVNDMEAYGLAHDLVDNVRSDLQRGKEHR
jgi:hypothetical protein